MGSEVESSCYLQSVYVLDLVRHVLLSTSCSTQGLEPVHLLLSKGDPKTNAPQHLSQSDS